MQTISLFRDLNRTGFHTSIITTFSVDAAFFDGSIFRRLRTNGCDNILLLADKRMLDRAIIETPESFRHAGTGYAVHPVEISKGCFHPKLHIRLGSDGGSLVIGSANATAAGWGGNRELVSRFEWWRRTEHADNEAARSLIRKAFNYVLPWIEQPGLSSLQRKLDFIERDASWLIEAAPNPEPVNLSDGTQADLFIEDARGTRSILRRFAYLIGLQAKRLIIISPYWDGDLKALYELQDRLEPAETVIAVSAHKPEFPVSALRRGRDVKFARVFDGAGSDRFIHAKVILVEAEDHDYLLFGSTNCSANALGLMDQPAVNAEASLYRRLPAGTGLAALGLDLSNHIDVADITPKIREDEPVTGATLPWPGSIEAAGKAIRWKPAASLVNAATGASILLGDEQHPFTRSHGDTHYLELPTLPKCPIIARIRLSDDRITSPVLVNDEIRLQQAAPGMGNRQLRAVLERIGEGDNDLLDLAAIASLIFGAPEKATSMGMRPSKGGAKPTDGKEPTDVGRDYESAEEFREALGNSMPVRGEDYRLNFDGPDEVYLFKILMRGMTDGETTDQLLAGDKEPLGADDGDDGNSTDESLPSLPRRKFTVTQIEKRRLDVIKAVHAFEKRLSGLKKSELPPPQRVTAEACFILSLMVQASRRAILREDEGKQSSVYALPLVPNALERDDTFVIRAGQILHALWVGTKSSPPLLSRLAIGRQFEELPYDCFALVVMSRWAAARCVLAMDNDRNKSLAEKITQAAIQIWRATALWPRVDEKAEIEFVRQLDRALGTDSEETEELLGHYSGLAEALSKAQAA